MFKTILTSFIIVFFAELGDKTQLSTMLLASKSNSIWYTFIGSSLALILASFIGVIVGNNISKYFPIQYIQYCSGVIFVVIGFLFLLGKI